MIEQLRVKLKNEPGTLKRMLGVLAAAGIDIKALGVSDRSSELGEANLIVSDAGKAADALARAGEQYQRTQVIAVEMADRVGGLESILEVLDEGRVNIDQLYAFVSRVEGKSLAVMAVNDPARAAELLRAGGFRLFGSEALKPESKPKQTPDSTSLVDHLGLDYIW